MIAFLPPCGDKLVGMGEELIECVGPAGAGAPTALTADPVYCEATFHYADRSQEFGRGGPRPDVVLPVHDGRQIDGLSFEANGFELMTFPSKVENWRDYDEVFDVHGPEVEAFATERLGCDVAMFYPPIIRSPENAKKVEDYAPILFVHSDFSTDYGPMTWEPHRPYREFIQPLLDQKGLTQDDLRNATRMVMIQFWRNIGPIEADHPLAVCDPRTIDQDRVVHTLITEYGGRLLEFEISAFMAPEEGDADRWVTYPQMQPDEVLAFRTYDSAEIEAGRPYWTPHSAFRDPSVPDGVDHLRESVEMRALCVWR